MIRAKAETTGQTTRPRSARLLVGQDLDLDLQLRIVAKTQGASESYIGLEFAQMYRRFGSRVTVIVIEKGDRLIAREDEDISTTLQKVLEAEGIAFRLNASCISLSRTASGVGVGMDCTNGAPEVEGSHVLIAVGRRPNQLTRQGRAQKSSGFSVNLAE